MWNFITTLTHGLKQTKYTHRHDKQSKKGLSFAFELSPFPLSQKKSLFSVCDLSVVKTLAPTFINSCTCSLLHLNFHPKLLLFVLLFKFI